MTKIYFGDMYDDVSYRKKQNVFIVRELNKSTLFLYLFYCMRVTLFNSLTTKFTSRYVKC